MSGNLPVTNDVADRLVRLPLWLGIEEHLDRIIEATFQFFGHACVSRHLNPCDSANHPVSLLVTGGAGFIGGNFVLGAVAGRMPGGQSRCADLRGQPGHARVVACGPEPRIRPRRHRRSAPRRAPPGRASAPWQSSISQPRATWTAPSMARRRSFRPTWSARWYCSRPCAITGGRCPTPSERHSAFCTCRRTRCTARSAMTATSPRHSPTRRIPRTRLPRPRPTTWCARSTIPMGCRY